MTVEQFIDQELASGAYTTAPGPQQIKELARFNNIKLDRPVMNIKLEKAYELARIMDIDAPELVSRIIQTELA